MIYLTLTDQYGRVWQMNYTIQMFYKGIWFCYLEMAA